MAVGVITLPLNKRFFFEKGRFIGQLKECKLFTSARIRNKYIETEQKGSWRNYYQICLKIAQITKLIHQVGLIYSDLSYNNIVIDPLTEGAYLVSYDQLTTSNTPCYISPHCDFVAPEYIANRNSSHHDNNWGWANIETNNHALAILIYQLLLYRHPLRGGKVHDLDATKDEELSMGKMALFIEHPTDQSNRPKVQNISPIELPQGDVTKLPYTICGPYITDLFDKAFIHGLHNPIKRPTAKDWVIALNKTMDLLLPCKNQECESKWFVFDNSKKTKCPFCGNDYSDDFAVLNFYSSNNNGKFLYDNHKLIVYDNQYLYKWHKNRFTTTEDVFLPENKVPIADFHFQNGKWNMINRSLPELWDKDTDTKIEIGQAVELTEGKKILLGKNDGDRLIIVQLVSN